MKDRWTHWHESELSLHEDPGKVEIGAEILLRISREFDKSIEWLLTGKDRLAEMHSLYLTLRWPLGARILKKVSHFRSRQVRSSHINLTPRGRGSTTRISLGLFPVCPSLAKLPIPPAKIRTFRQVKSFHVNK